MVINSTNINKTSNDLSPKESLSSDGHTNLVFSSFISRGKILCYNRAKINSFILKCLENSLENQPITPKFIICIVYILHYTKQSLDLPMEKFNGKVFFIFFVSPLIHIKLKKSTIEFHISKNILKMIKQTNHAKFCSIYRIHIYTLWYVDFM